MPTGPLADWESRTEFNPDISHSLPKNAKVLWKICKSSQVPILNLYLLKDARKVDEKVGQEKKKTKEDGSSQCVAEVES